MISPYIPHVATNHRPCQPAMFPKKLRFTHQFLLNEIIPCKCIATSCISLRQAYDVHHQLGTKTTAYARLCFNMALAKQAQLEFGVEIYNDATGCLTIRVDCFCCQMFVLVPLHEVKKRTVQVKIKALTAFDCVKLGW